jgi:alpha-tubulin suppressor-like RCC1 family protein
MIGERPASVLSLCPMRALLLSGVLSLSVGCLSPITSQAPEPPPEPGNVEFVTAGSRHACALLEGGAVRCWGAGGLVGDGTRSLRVEPVPVKGLRAGVLALSAGTEHTCELSTSGHVKCWGENARGQLGLGSTVASLEPMPIPQLSEGVAQVSAGANHTCAVLSDGEVRCWGVNDQYQLGGGVASESLQPVPVKGLTEGIRNLAAGSGHTCAVTALGEVHCWGGNANGELGLGVVSVSVAQPSKVLGLPDPMMMVAAGRNHTCGVSVKGAVWCWGDNENGALGDDRSIDSPVPVAPARCSRTAMRTAGAATPTGSWAMAPASTARGR